LKLPFFVASAPAAACAWWNPALMTLAFSDAASASSTALARSSYAGPISVHLEYKIPGTTPEEIRRNTMAAATRDLDFVRLDEKAFMACPSESIDYAVMEKTGDAVVVEADIGWSDIGSTVCNKDPCPRCCRSSACCQPDCYVAFQRSL